MKRSLAALAALLLLAGCGSSEDSDNSTDGTDDASSSQESTAPEEGTEIEGTGYTYRVPEDWGIPEEEIPGFNADSLAVSLEDTDGFTDNVNVMKSPAGEITPDDAEQAAQQELKTVGAENITINDRVDVAGEAVPHVSAEMSQGDIEYATEQYFVSTEGQTFVVTFSFSRDRPTEEREQVTGPVLASWTWTD